MRASSPAIAPPALAALALALGCSSSGGGAASGPGAAFDVGQLDAWCGSVCDRAVTCNSRVDKPTCVNQCKNTNAATAPHARADYLQAYLDCVNATDCAAIGSSATACTDKARASIAPTPVAQSFCEALIKKQTDCKNTTVAPAKCLDSVKIVDDGSLGQASDCLAKACADYQACVLAAVGAK